MKPFAAGLVTNMVIATDRRAYHLALESTNRTAMAAISWTDPQDRLLVLQRQNQLAEQARPVASDIALADLRFAYAITGDNPPWRPMRAWDDGRKVYIEFPARLDQGEAPPLFVVGPRGDSQLVNYRVSGNHYIVDRLFLVPPKCALAKNCSRSSASAGPTPGLRGSASERGRKFSRQRRTG